MGLMREPSRIMRGRYIAPVVASQVRPHTRAMTIATLQLPDTGSARLGSIDVVKQPDEIRKVLGYLPQEFGLYPNLSAETTLDHFATMKGIIDARERRELVQALLQQTILYEAR